MFGLFEKKNVVLDRKIESNWDKVKQRLKSGGNIVDLGCGNNPVAGAKTAVDFYMDPKERNSGTGPTIDLDLFKSKKIEFVHARVDGILPFKDKQFDFAYSHHVFEHLDDPQTACQEMVRIAKSGAIITPSWFAECMFGRPYHRWLIMERSARLLFFRKRPFEQTPFGEAPKFDARRKKFVANDQTNPFDMLLNEGNWYWGREGNMPKLSGLLQKHWRAHSPLFEIVFLWHDSFEWKIFDDQ